MKYENIKSALEVFDDIQGRINALNHGIGVLYLDAVTVAPKGSGEGRSLTMGALSSMIYEIISNPENVRLLDYLELNKDELSESKNREVTLMKESCTKLSRIPQDEYVEYNMLLSKAQDAWEDGKNSNDFSIFAPYLEKLVEFNRKFAGYYNPKLSKYDALLNEYEEGLTMETLDKFFAQLRETIVPLIEKIKGVKQIDSSFLNKTYPIDKQRELAYYAMDLMGINRDYCVLSESEHPFTSGFNNKDVRITTHYYENDLASSLYSVIHEGGHAIYEMGCEDEYNFTPLYGGSSMSMHESQSRFYENIIGRSREFISCIYPKIKELFPQQLEGVSQEEFYRAINKAEPSLIRTEADELTYCMHVMVRYEIEKKLIGGELQVKDVPEEWNRLYKEYLGIDVPDDRSGCLQDSHWSGGSFGYFPTYALGSAYGAQMLKVMEKDLGNVFEKVAKGNLQEITAWLKEKIHRHGNLYVSTKLFKNVCGEFDAKYYTDYLKKKYSEIYGI